MPKDDPKQMQSAHEWLDTASAELGLDEALIRRLAGPLLELTREVAHNRSRPAAPLTAFLVGLSVSGQRSGDEVVADVEKRINDLMAAARGEA